MVILGHHETFIQLIQYILALFAGGWICFKWLFPMLGRGIVNLCKKLEDVNLKWSKREKERLLQKKKKLVQQRKDQIKRFEDDQCVIDGFYMDQSEIESVYKGRWVQEEQDEKD